MGYNKIRKQLIKNMGHYPPGQKKKSIVSFLIWFGVFILLIPIMYYFASHAANAKDYTTQDNLLGSIIIAFFSACGLYLIYKLIMFAIRRPAWGIPILAIVIGPAVIGGLIFYLSYNQAEAPADIQESLTEIASAKLLGDSIIKKGKLTDSSFNDVQASVATASEKLIGLSVPDSFKNYQATAILWSIRVASAAEQTAGWKNLKNQPDASPLTISDADAKSYFNASLKIIADLKKSGEDAIKNKDRDAMRQIAAKLLIQQHWLNAILYAQKNSIAFNLVTPVLAALSVPEVKKGVDVTCSVCDYPDAYKVQWTDKLRQLYRCDTRCHLQAMPAMGGTAPGQDLKNQEKNKNAENTAVSNDASKYAEALAGYTYKDIPKRAICIGNNAGGVFCVEEAVSSTNEIAASAVGFAAGTKPLTVSQWDNEYQDIDLAALPANTTGETGEAPSQPSAEGGHQEGGMGTIEEGEPKSAPASKPSSPAPTSKSAAPAAPAESQAEWDGYYSGYVVSQCKIYTAPSILMSEVGVQNNRAFDRGLAPEEMGSAPIGPDGYAELNLSWQTAEDPSGANWKVTFQFTHTGDTRSVEEVVKSTTVFGNIVDVCMHTFKGTRK